MHIMCRCVNYNTINNICVYRADSYSAQNGSESRFRDRCFSVELCYILWSVPLHHWICIEHCRSLIAPLELYCASVSQYYLSFKLSGKVAKDLMRRVCVTVTEIQT